MAKAKNFYQCQACGYVSPKWLGRCPDCGEWNTLAEEKKGGKKGLAIGSGEPVSLDDVVTTAGERVLTGISEFDRVLGGGLVQGSVVLVGGDPGIGKSTLLLQAVSRIGGSVLYVSGEESPAQIKLRAERLSVDAGSVVLLPETALGNVLDVAARTSPRAVVIDSIQTMYDEGFDSAPGSVGQVRECSTRMMMFAKRSGVPVFIIGHVTKEGAIAGPRVLEHIVDTVLYFEGDKGHPYRILRTVKNRFGSTNEIGVFEMTDAGLSEVENPSTLFLSERLPDVSGSVVVSSMEGTRPVLVELQALVSQATFGTPRRTSIGLDFQRVNLLIAVLEKVGGLQLGAMDVYTNVVGGLRISEPAVDLAVVIAVTSSLRERPVGTDVFVFGEVGLSGEVRAVSQAETRLKEAAKIGFKKAIVPAANAERISSSPGLEIVGVRSVTDALEAAGI